MSEPTENVILRGDLAATLAEYVTLCSRHAGVMLTLGKAELVARIVLDALAKDRGMVENFDFESPPLFVLPQK